MSGSSGCTWRVSWHGQRARRCAAGSAVALVGNWFDPKFPVENTATSSISSALDQIPGAAVPGGGCARRCRGKGSCQAMAASSTRSDGALFCELPTPCRVQDTARLGKLQGDRKKCVLTGFFKAQLCVDLISLQHPLCNSNPWH